MTEEVLCMLVGRYVGGDANEVSFKVLSLRTGVLAF
jgi:hypothetical protein